MPENVFHGAVLDPIALPAPRGPLSDWMLDRLTGGDRPAPTSHAAEAMSDDFQLALYLAYESHFSWLPGQLIDLEWDPSTIRFRSILEDALATFLAQQVGHQRSARPVERLIPELIAADEGPSLSTHIERAGTLDHLRQIVIHRSLYQLKEGDAHTFAIPRLRGRAKQLLAGIQAGEYGADAPAREMHSTLFAHTMRTLGLDARLHAYLDHVPASAFMISNLVSLFGLNRRWRGALVGHLAVFEMTSVTPMGRYLRGLERMGLPEAARRFYDVHTQADAEHGIMALDMVARFSADEPHLRDDVLFGARCVLLTEAWFAGTLLEGFHAGDAPQVAA